jgi:hypothetical protein
MPHLQIIWLMLDVLLNFDISKRYVLAEIEISDISSFSATIFFS